MRSLSTKPDMDTIRREGQDYLAQIEKRGFELPSIEKFSRQSTIAKHVNHQPKILQGFAEDDQAPLKRN